MPTQIIINVRVTNGNSSNIVKIQGPGWNGWDPTAGPTATYLGDHMFQFSIDYSPGMEYKIVLNGVPEDLVTFGKQTNDWSATPITDYYTSAWVESFRLA